MMLYDAIGEVYRLVFFVYIGRCLLYHAGEVIYTILQWVVIQWYPPITCLAHPHSTSKCPFKIFYTFTCTQ